jgi:hypothetical protein
MPKIDRLAACTTQVIEEAEGQIALEQARFTLAQRELDQTERAFTREAAALEAGRFPNQSTVDRVIQARRDVAYRGRCLAHAEDVLGWSCNGAVVGEHEPGGVVGPGKGLLRLAGRRKGLTTTVGTGFVGRRRHNSWKRHRRTQYRQAA